MALSQINKLKAKIQGKKYLPYKQDGKEYNLYDLPKGFVIKGNLFLANRDLTELPDLSEVVVEGFFSCKSNELTSLKGAPKEVGTSFECEKNNLTTLEGAPQKVGLDFNCGNNHLTSLKGAPKEVGRNFYCHNNQLTTLEGAPQEVKGCFDCSYCGLTTLKGAPKEVGGSFRCTDNSSLTSLKGVSATDDYHKIYCDNALGEKYGFSNCYVTCAMEEGGINFARLQENPLYQEEMAADDAPRKIQMSENLEDATAKTKAAFEAWLKEKGIESTRK